MFISELHEINALVPEELSEDIEGLIGVSTTEGERTGPVLRPGPVRLLRPDHPVPDAVGTQASGVHIGVAPSIHHRPVVTRWWHRLELETLEGSF